MSGSFSRGSFKGGAGNFSTNAIFGRSGLGGDDIPYRRSPHKGWSRKDWEARVRDPEREVEKTLREAYAELTREEAAISTLARVDAIVRPAAAKPREPDAPLRIDWERLARDYERASAIVRLWQEERALQALIDDEDELMMLATA